MSSRGGASDGARATPGAPSTEAHLRPRVLYVEDDERIAEMTAEVLSDAYTVDVARDLRSGLELALHNPYDVMIIDRRLPDGDGRDLAAAVRTARITTPMLLLTALGSIDDRVDGLDAGANDYLVKPFDHAELLARLRALRRAFHAEGRRRQLGDWTYVPDSRVLYAPTGRRVALTETESALLTLLTGSPEHTFSRDEILHAVFTAADAPASVDTYVHYVRRKTVPDIIETVRGRGYRAGAPE